MRLSSDCMGFLYIAEETSPEENVVTNMKTFDRDGVFYVEFDTCLHSFDVMNRNSRMYKARNIDSCLKTERIQHYLSHGGWFGEQNHPISKYKDRPLSNERIRDIDMDNTSHKMINPTVVGNKLMSRVQSDAGTRQGMNLARKMVQGFVPGFSCRAIALMNITDGKPIVDVRQLITYDWVLYQSHREAEQTGKTSFIHKNVPGAGNLTKITESGSDDVAIQLTDLMKDVGYTNVNSQIVMEHFGLTDSDLIGFTDDTRQLIMRDNNNIVYCNIDLKSRNKVNEFLRSF